MPDFKPQGEISANDFISRLTPLLEPFGFSHFGATELSTPLTMDVYKAWIQQGKHGEMSYLETHLPQKEKPQTLSARARSAIVIAQAYVPHPAPTSPFPSSKVALYAHGEDYHHWFKEKLARACELLSAQFPEEEFLPLTDSGPVLERDLAYRAGLGWVGKNTCLIHPKKGSLFLIGEIITSLPLGKPLREPSPGLPDMCGTCTRCMDLCPTGAITEAKSLDARKCISYLTIESREVPEDSLRKKMGDWLFGCDICQTVCPWNQKNFKEEFLRLKTPLPREGTIADLRFLLSASGKQIEKKGSGNSAQAGGTFWPSAKRDDRGRQYRSPRASSRN